jgi:hypothetical protein
MDLDISLVAAQSYLTIAEMVNANQTDNYEFQTAWVE